MKFDQIINEAEANINPTTLDRANDAIQHLPSKDKDTLNATLDKLGTQGGSNHELLTTIADMLNDETPTKFSSLDPSIQAKTLELFKKAGLDAKPIDTGTVSSTKPVTPTASSSEKNNNTQTDNNVRSVNPPINTKVQGAVV